MKKNLVLVFTLLIFVLGCKEKTEGKVNTSDFIAKVKVYNMLFEQSLQNKNNRFDS